MKKRLITILLALVLICGFAAPAYATETESTGTTESTEATGETTQATEMTTATEPPATEATEPPTQPTETEPESTEAPTQPTTPATEPTQPATEPVGMQIPTAMEIDTEHIYVGMDKAYEDGYVPKVKDGYAYLVLPLISNGEIYNEEIKASLNLGGSSAPFVIANYEKTVKLQSIIPEGGKEEVAVYLVEFEIPLAKNRTNGVYPVTVNITGYAEDGTPIDCIHTLYVTITDGKSSEPAQPYVETPTAEPVVYIAGTTLQPEKIMAGEEFTLTLTLKNSLTTKSVKNMMVTVDTGNLQISLLEDTNTFLIDKIAAGGETQLTLRFGSDASIPAGKYTMNFSFHYDSSKTLNLSSSGTTIVEISQPTNMELVMPRFPDSVTVGETIPLSLQVMNMGRDRVYNVRCVVEGFGFSPSNTGFIGTMEAGSSASTEVELYIIALNASKGNESGNQYGDTTGTITLIYENESGEEFQQEMTFDTTVNRPVVELPQTKHEEEEQEKTAGNWWLSVCILGGVIIAAILIAIILGRKRKKGSAYL